MTTLVDVANRALGLARARTTLTSLVGTDPEIVNVNLNLTPIRLFLLRSFYWNFAKSFATLTLTKTATGVIPWTNAQPPPPWPYEYNFPSNCVAIRFILGQPNASLMFPIFPVQVSSVDTEALYYKWELINDGGTRQIVTDAPNAVACITLDVTDPDFWENDFREAFVALLAAKIIIPLSGDIKLAQILQQQAIQILMEAKTEAANEGIDIVDNLPDTLKARQTWGLDG